MPLIGSINTVRLVCTELDLDAQCMAQFASVRICKEKLHK